MLVRLSLCAVLASVLIPESALAERDDHPPFYTTAKQNAERGTQYSGSITSSSFYFTESGDDGKAVDGVALVTAASPVSRVFTDLRLRLSVRRDANAGNVDFRLRLKPDICKKREDETRCPASQSGTFGEHEFDARELYYRHDFKSFSLTAGRQYMLEIAAIKFDGVRVDKAVGTKWKYFGFSGLYPTRGSRNVGDDYGEVPSNADAPDGAQDLVLPLVGGAGASFRGQRAYASVGAAGILPNATDQGTNKKEKLRLLLAFNGHWQASNTADLYGTVVVDATGAAGAGPRNLSLGGNLRPTKGLTLFGQVNLVDTETLNVHAQQRLDNKDLDGTAANQIQNNWSVTRVAQESATAGASMAFARSRFQITATGTFRVRPAISLEDNGGNEVRLPVAQAADMTLRAVDRRSLGGFRFAAGLTKTIGVGDENLDRSTAIIARVDASREFLDGDGEFELNLSYLKSTDENLEHNCGTDQLDFLACYGSAKVSTLGLGGLVFYRPARQWLTMASVTVANQSLDSSMEDGTRQDQPTILMLTGFLRLAYRF